MMDDKTTDRILNGMLLLIFILLLVSFYMFYLNFQKEKELDQRTEIIQDKIELMEKVVDKVAQPVKEQSHDPE